MNSHDWGDGVHGLRVAYSVFSFVISLLPVHIFSYFECIRQDLSRAEPRHNPDARMGPSNVLVGASGL